MENLTPDQWAGVLSSEVTLENAAANLKKGEVQSWAFTLLQFTEDSNQVLDLGCGRGEHSAWLALHGKKPTLLDWSEANLEFSRRLFAKLGLAGTFQRADITQPLPFADNSFDSVFCCSLLQYFTDEEIDRILKETFRVTRNQVIAMVPNALSVFYRIGKRHMEKKGEWRWGKERPRRTLLPHFRSATDGKLVEFTVDAYHSFDFLDIRASRWIKKFATCKSERDRHHVAARFRQGYMLVTVGEKQSAIPRDFKDR